MIARFLLLLFAFMPVLGRAEDWGADFSAQHYFLPLQDDLFIPTVSAYTDKVFLSARYNYEGRDALSLWIGRPFSFGEEWEFELIPMAGGIVNEVEGMAPGFIADINWKGLNIYSEMEYVFDFETRENNFFYSWSEATYAIVDWLRIGIVGNRTRVYDSSVEVDRGPIVKAEIGRAAISCTVLNLDSSAIFIAGFEFSLG